MPFPESDLCCNDLGGGGGVEGIDPNGQNHSRKNAAQVTPAIFLPPPSHNSSQERLLIPLAVQLCLKDRHLEREVIQATLSSEETYFLPPDQC